MKKKIIFLTAALFIGALFFNSCKKTDSVTNKEETNLTSLSSFYNPKYPMNVRLAQRYYDKLKREQGDEVKLTSNNLSQKEMSNKKHPIWKKAYEGKTSSSTFIEVPLVYDRRISSVIMSKPDSIGPDMQKELASSILDRLLILKDKTSGEVTQYIVSYIPSRNYAVRHNKDISHNQINKLDKDFEGYIRYKNWDESLFALYKVSHGKFVYKFENYNPKQSGQRKITASSQQARTCVEWTLFYDIHVVQNCGSSYGPDGYHETCGPWYVEEEYYWWECTRFEEDVPPPPPPPGDGDGDGGNQNGNQDPPQDPCNDPSFVCPTGSDFIVTSISTAIPTDPGEPALDENGNWVRTDPYVWNFCESHLWPFEKYHWRFTSYEQTESGKTGGEWRFTKVEHKKVLLSGTVVPGFKSWYESGSATANILEEGQRASMRHMGKTYLQLQGCSVCPALNQDVDASSNWSCPQYSGY